MAPAYDRLMEDCDVVVIGAGPAGLAVGVELGRAGASSVILEQGRLGAAWRGRHGDLRLNTLGRFSGLPGAPIPRAYGRWVGRDDYVAYLERFAGLHGLVVREHTAALRVSAASGRWRVDTLGGPIVAGDVVVATGHQRVPWRPDWPDAGLYAGDLRHVAEIEDPASLHGRDVLVVGGGNSGVEWSEHLARVGAGRIWLSVRTPPNLIPREVRGIPIQGLSVLLEPLPTWLKDANARLVSALVIGNLGPYGLPTPSEGPFRRLERTGVTAAVDSGFSRLVRSGRIVVVPEIAGFTRNGVTFDGATELRPATVLAATGYRPILEQLVGELGVLDPKGLPYRDVRGESPRSGLWFVGFSPAIEGVLRAIGREARQIARAIGLRHGGRAAPLSRVD